MISGRFRVVTLPPVEINNWWNDTAEFAFVLKTAVALVVVHSACLNFPAKQEFHCGTGNTPLQVEAIF